MFLLTVAFLLSGVVALPTGRSIESRALPVGVKSTTIYPNGSPVTIHGIRYSGGVDKYAGVPYAESPTGDLRFSPPQDRSYSKDEHVFALLPPKFCLQNLKALNLNSLQGVIMSEDCLYLDIVTPSNSYDLKEKLPVVFSIPGGGFATGGTAIYPGIPLVTRSMSTGIPVVFVSMQYRLGIFGFPSGPVFQDNGAANLGLKDQLKALEWVRENIGYFGGDRDKITLWGESAGAISIGLHYINPNILNQNLFRAAILMSGSPSSAHAIPTIPQNLSAYDSLLANVGCTENTLACLRGLSGDTLLEASSSANILNWAPTIDGDLIPDSTHKLMSEGKFCRAPLITGDMKDEGTLFTSPLLLPEQNFREFFQASYAGLVSDETIDQLLEVYPNVPSLGSPFDTGNETFGLAPEFKQWAAIAGDTYFQAPRRDFLSQLYQNGQTKIWTYIFDQKLTLSLVPGYLGVFHALDLFFIYGWTNIAQFFGLDVVFSDEDDKLAQQMMDYYLRFTNYLDPNGPNTSSSTLPDWPTWDPSTKSMLNFTASGEGITLRKDHFREEQIDWILDHWEEFGL